MNELQLRQSWRYGRDRVYATDVQGSVLGWWDAAAAEIRVPVAHHATVVVKILTAWLAREERLGRIPAGTSDAVELHIGRDWPIKATLRSAGAMLLRALHVGPSSARPLAL